MPFAFEFGDDHHRDHDVVLGESEERARIAQQHRCVEHVGAQRLILLGIFDPAVLVNPVLCLCCPCGHNPLPPRVVIPGTQRVDQGSRVAILTADPVGRLARRVERTTGIGRRRHRHAVDTVTSR